MGLPQIMIEFQTAGATAIRRSSRGKVALVVSGSGEAATYASLAKAEAAGLSDRLLNLLRLCFFGSPAEVTVVYDSGDSTYALSAAARAATGGWICAPDMPAATLCAFVKAQRATGEAVRAVAANADAPDCEGIVNLTVSGLQVRLWDTVKALSAADYTARIAGILAGLPLTRSATYLALPEVMEFQDQENPDDDIAQGRLILYRGASAIRLGRAVTSLVTLTPEKGSAFQKIKIAEGVDLIRSDIRTVFEQDYIGQVLGDYDAKLLLVTAITEYLHSLEGSVLDPAGDNSAGIDLAAQQHWLEQQGVDTRQMAQVDILKANTGSQVFLTATLRFADAMEDLRLQVSM